MLLCEYVFMRTTVDLPDPIFRRMKAKAALEGASVKEFVQRAVERELAQPPVPKKTRRIKVPIIRERTGYAIPLLSREEVDEFMFGRH